MLANNRRILITGGGTFLGNNIAAALLAEGAEVTLLVQAGCEDNLGLLAERVRWFPADFWDTASLRGRARGHRLVIHCTGSLKSDPREGLSFHRLNFISARHAATMCVSDGVPEMLLISSPRAPWTSRRYIRAKREAEAYLRRVGVKGTVIRAPVVYGPGERRPLLMLMMTALGSVPPLSWLWFGRIAPMRIDMLARGVARLAMEPERTRTIYYARDLRRRNRHEERAVLTPILVDPSLSPDETHPHGVVVVPNEVTEDASEDEI